MIFSCPQGLLSDAPASRFKGEQGEALAIYEAAAVENQPNTEFNFDAIIGEKAEIQPRSIELVEEFDWSNPKLKREFIQLEQKVLAKKASHEEFDRYSSMKSDRNGLIFSDRYVADYAEIQRLKILSEKIAEIQKFLRPISLG